MMTNEKLWAQKPSGKAEGALAVFTIKVQVAVVVVASPLFVAQLVVYDASSVLKGVHHVVL